MIEIALTLILSLSILIGWFFIFPVRFAKAERSEDPIVYPPEGFLYSYVLHLHTQFSYDSLGKPEDVMRTRDIHGIDFVLVTDHDNDHIGKFADDRLIAGKEVKLNDEEGNLLGDMLLVGDLKIVAHPFRSKYRWRLEKSPEYFLELIDLRDALLERKTKLFLYLLCGLFLYPVAGKRIVGNYAKLVDTELYVRRYFEESWKSRVVGGLDHHVKLYLREVRKRVLIPDYGLSFLLMRNYLLTDRQVKGKEDFLQSLRDGINLLSFSPKPSFVWTEDRTIKVYSPFSNTFVVLLSEGGERREVLGSNVIFDNLKEDTYFILGYTYLWRIGRLLFGVKPLFVSDRLEVR